MKVKSLTYLPSGAKPTPLFLSASRRLACRPSTCSEVRGLTGRQPATAWQLEAETLVALELIDAEVLSVLRRAVLGGELAPEVLGLHVTGNDGKSCP